ncbi:MAG: hypothetical protein ACI9DF_003358, partial [Verrucomicrobiales bacterium]
MLEKQPENWVPLMRDGAPFEVAMRQRDPGCFQMTRWPLAMKSIEKIRHASMALSENTHYTPIIPRQSVARHRTYGSPSDSLGLNQRIPKKSGSVRVVFVTDDQGVMGSDSAQHLSENHRPDL